MTPTCTHILMRLQSKILADFKLSFESYPIEAAEGDQDVQVCVRLGGSNWLDLERQLTLELSSDGGTQTLDL